MVKVNGWAMTCWRGTALSRTSLLGATTSHTLTINREMMEKANSTSSRAREYLPGLSDWSLNVERFALVDDANISVIDEVSNLKAGDTINVCMLIGLDYYVGPSIIESIDINGPYKGKSTARLALRGAGTLNLVDVNNDGFTFTFPMAFDVALGAESTTE